ncbi:hypothetical protein BU23DRAFT_569236 [Bimuria novae-zelandiae CBS 107.79]|uniref:Uncharacterized protein n=1 Tax=Bimuria novae-zelandiae CBS 107.79 TaxID=1447943 RepID=A0A6A5V5A7_9PLEO|nr:hypothetical protein BU23DRAFT_569236 [Bimuria novae-zelandiae CBS 107.79]
MKRNHGYPAHAFPATKRQQTAAAGGQRADVGDTHQQVPKALPEQHLIQSTSESSQEHATEDSIISANRGFTVSDCGSSQSLSLGGSRSEDMSTEFYYTDKNGHLSVSWTLLASNAMAIVSLDPSSKFWTRLDQSCISTTPGTETNAMSDTTALVPLAPMPLFSPGSEAIDPAVPQFRFFDLNKDVRLMVYDCFTVEVNLIAGGLTLLLSVKFRIGEGHFCGAVRKMIEEGVELDEIEQPSLKREGNEGKLGAFVRTLVVEPYTEMLALGRNSALNLAV